jgi:hypothetical protein
LKRAKTPVVSPDNFYGIDRSVGAPLLHEWVAEPRSIIEALREAMDRALREVQHERSIADMGPSKSNGAK